MGEAGFALGSRNALAVGDALDTAGTLRWCLSAVPDSCQTGLQRLLLMIGQI